MTIIEDGLCLPIYCRLLIGTSSSKEQRKSVSMLGTRPILRNRWIIQAFIVRTCKTIDKKADVIKRVNSDNKALFGPVLKEKKSRKKKQKPKPIVPPSNGEKVLQSEMFWLLQASSKSLRATSTTSKIPKSSNDTKQVGIENRSVINNEARTGVDKNLEDDSEDDLLNFQLSLVPPAIKDAKKNRSNIATRLDIPFSETEIKNLLNYPMKNSKSKNNKLVGNDQKLLFPSVTKILQATMPESSRQALMKWKTLKIAELGEDGFKELQQNHFNQGSQFHSSIERYFKTKVTPLENSLAYQTWISVSPLLTDISTEPAVIEGHLHHPALSYKGVVDCVAEYSNELSVIEWKKSDQRKITIGNTYDAPLQLCAYVGALSADPSYSLDIRHGLVVVAYTDGHPCNSYQLKEVDLQRYWRMWLSRLQEYWIRYRDGTLPEPI